MKVNTVTHICTYWYSVFHLFLLKMQILILLLNVTCINGIYCQSIISFSRLILADVWQTLWQPSCHLPGDMIHLLKNAGRWGRRIDVVMCDLRSLCWGCDVWLKLVFRLWYVTWVHCLEVLMCDLRLLCWGCYVWLKVVLIGCHVSPEATVFRLCGLI